MRFGSRKGFTGIEVVVILCAMALVGYFAVPNIGKGINNVFQGGQNRQKQIHKVTEQYTMFYKDSKGNFVPAPVPYKRTEDSLNFTNTEPPETLWSKFWHMGAVAVAIIVLLSYLGLWPLITLWWNKKVKPKIAATQAELEAIKIAKEDLTGDAKKIVFSVDEGLAQFDSVIEASRARHQAAQDLINSASGISDSAVRQATIDSAQAAHNIAQAVLDAVTQLKIDFLSAMSRKQDASTKLLVSNLLLKDSINGNGS